MQQLLLTNDMLILWVTIKLPSANSISLMVQVFASTFTKFSNLFFESGLLLNVGMLFPGNSSSAALRILARL